MNKDQRFCQSCGMPLTEDVLGTNADGTKNEDYCMYCYKDGKFLQDCTMEEMIEHCAQFVGAVNEGLENPITKEEPSLLALSTRGWRTPSPKRNISA